MSPALIAVLVLVLAGCGSNGKAGTVGSAGSGISGIAVLSGAFGQVPFADARVLVREADNLVLRQTTAALDGSFRVTAPAGDYAVAAVYQGTPSPPRDAG